MYVYLTPPRRRGRRGSHRGRLVRTARNGLLAAVPRSRQDALRPATTSCVGSTRRRRMLLLLHGVLTASASVGGLLRPPVHATPCTKQPCCLDGTGNLTWMDCQPGYEFCGVPSLTQGPQYLLRTKSSLDHRSGLQRCFSMHVPKILFHPEQVPPEGQDRLWRERSEWHRV
jgi:hypothetical protein